MATHGLAETFETPVFCLHIEYGCEGCKNHNPEHHQSCGINLMLPPMLIMNGWRQCPLRNKSEQEIQEFMNQSK